MGSIPARDATFGWTETCATPGPECSMAPSPMVASKSWYNTYLYVPEQRSHVERQFLERFVQGPEGEWIDVVKCRRMASYLQEKQEKACRERQLDAGILAGTDIRAAGYTDAYSGEPLINFHGLLMSREELFRRHHLHRSALEETIADSSSGSFFDFDNLRVPPWPFGRPDRNKRISEHVYEWFDRRNTYIPSDKDFEIVEMADMYVDRDTYRKWSGSESHEIMVPVASLPRGQGSVPQYDGAGAPPGYAPPYGNYGR